MERCKDLRIDQQQEKAEFSTPTLEGKDLLHSKIVNLLSLSVASENNGQACYLLHAILLLLNILKLWKGKCWIYKKGTQQWYGVIASKHWYLVPYSSEGVCICNLLTWYQNLYPLLSNFINCWAMFDLSSQINWIIDEAKTNKINTLVENLKLILQKFGRVSSQFSPSKCGYIRETSSILDFFKHFGKSVCSKNTKKYAIYKTLRGEIF